jgi:hypothetical protein
MSARNFLGVIPSDEVAAATEESRDPYSGSTPRSGVVPATL